MTNLVGRRDIEDALQKLEILITEEARMTGVETLKAIHGVGNKVGDEMHGIHGAVKAVEDRVKDVEGMIQGVGDMLQDFDSRVKGIGDIATIGEQKCENFIPSSVDVYIVTCQKTNSTSDGRLPRHNDTRKSEGHG